MACPRFTPPGWSPCTRDPDHDGPCAHEPAPMRDFYATEYMWRCRLCHEPGQARVVSASIPLPGQPSRMYCTNPRCPNSHPREFAVSRLRAVVCLFRGHVRAAHDFCSRCGDVILD